MPKTKKGKKKTNKSVGADAPTTVATADTDRTATRTAKGATGNAIAAANAGATTTDDTAPIAGEEEEDCAPHIWECLRDRVHNKGRGKGKYMCYRCTECGAFERRRYGGHGGSGKRRGGDIISKR